MKKCIRFLIVICLWTSSPIFALPSSFRIPDSDIDKIRQNPPCIYSSFNKHKADLQRQLPSVSDEELYIIFCSITAYSMAPYGPCDIKDLDNLEHLLKSPTLHCGNYGFLMMKLAQAGIPNIEEYVKVHSVAWKNGPFGPHGTNFIHRTHDDGIFLDPTCGLVAFSSFNHICMGKPVKPEKIINFGFRSDIKYFRNVVIHSLIDGLCKPSQIFLYFKSTAVHAEFFRNHYTSCDWIPTPSGQMVNK